MFKKKEKGTEILMLNPSPSKRKKGSTMSRKARPVRKNTIRKPSVIRPAIARAMQGISIKQAVQSIPPMQIGMFVAYAAARIGDTEKARRDDPDSWGARQYIQSAAGVLGAAYLVKGIRPGWGQMVLNVGLNTLLHQVMQNHLISKSDGAKAWLGASDGDNYVPSEYMGSSPLFGTDGSIVGAVEYDSLNGTDRIVPRDHLGDAQIQPSRLGSDDSIQSFTSRWS
jgi:hypothetical protein